MTLATEADAKDVIVHAQGYLARLDGAHVDPCRKALMEYGPYIEVQDRVGAHLLLWEATRDPADLNEAHRLLEYLVENAPEDCRESMIENVPTHRRIAEAWKKHVG